MTEKEISVERTEVVEDTEMVTYCDSCGAYGPGVEIVELSRNPRFEAVDAHGRYARRCTPTSGSIRDLSLSRTQGHIEFTAEHEGVIHACEDCLREQFDERAVTPELIPERDTDDSTDDKGGSVLSYVSAWTGRRWAELKPYLHFTDYRGEPDVVTTTLWWSLLGLLFLLATAGVLRALGVPPFA